MKIYSYIITSLLLLLFSCKGTQQQEQNKTDTASIAITEEMITLSEAQFREAGINTISLEERMIQNTIQVNGTVDVPPQNLISVSFPMGAFVKSTDLLPGKKVRKGEVLAVMEDQAIIQLQQDYLISKAQIHFLKKELERQTELNKDKSNSDKQFQLAQVEYETQRATYKALEEKLKMIGINPGTVQADNIRKNVTIHSPINGYAVKVLINKGKYLAPTDVLFELVNMDDLHAALTVYEQDLPFIHPGQRVNVYPADQPDKKLDATVLLVNRYLDEKRTSIVHCHFDKPDLSIVPGMFLKAEIINSERKVFAVPVESVIRFGNKQFVFTEKEKRTYLMKEIIPGDSSKGFWELKNSDQLKQDKIVSSGSYQLLSALKNRSEEE